MNPNSSILGDDGLVAGGNGFKNPEIKLVIKVEKGAIYGFQRVNDGCRGFFGLRGLGGYLRHEGLNRLVFPVSRRGRPRGRKRFRWRFSA
jgi:hypothetical protein